MFSFAHAPLGTPIPDSPHAVSVSFPTLADVIGFERGEPRVFESLTLGYPRFMRHPFVVEAEQHLREKHKLSDGITVLLADKKAVAWLQKFVGETGKTIVEKDFVAVHLSPSYEIASRAKAFLQFTGVGISSRLAEDYLIAEKVHTHAMKEKTKATDGSTFVSAELARLYGAPAENVWLAPFGMGAFFAAFRAINAIQKSRGRTRWLQLGWLYSDTIRVLERFSEAEPFVQLDVVDTAAVEKLLAQHGDEIAGIVTETPTNPLVQTPDLEQIFVWAKKFEVALVVDNTLGTPVNLDVLPHADIAVESLTKFASGHGDTALGAMILNSNSNFADELQKGLSREIVPPYHRDVNRLADSLQSYEARMQKIGANTISLVEKLKQIEGITAIHSALEGVGAANYQKLLRPTGSPTGIVSLEFDRPLAEVYDRLELAKGPSFGMEFTLVCPYLFMAHYDLVSTKRGREQLRRQGLNPELLRISVGLEDPTQIAAAIASALACQPKL